MEDDDPDLMTAAELADWLNVAQATLARWRRIGRGPKATKIGRQVRYSRRGVRAWIAGNDGV